MITIATNPQDRSGSIIENDNKAHSNAAPGLSAEPASQPGDSPVLQGPRSPAHLFWAFSSLSLQGFGGVQAIAQNELVERKRWMSREQFMGEWAVAQVLPGPNIINLSLMTGDRYFGLRGALAAMAGMVSFPLLLVLALAAVFSSVGELQEVQGALRGMGAVIIGLFVVNAVKLIEALRQNAMGLPACWAFVVPTFIAVGWMRLPLVWVILVVGGLASFWAWRQLGAVAALRAAKEPGE